jgi:amino acid permease
MRKTPLIENSKQALVENYSMGFRSWSRARSQVQLEGFKKAGLLTTAFTLIKGFLGTGILFLPMGFKSAGY